MFSFIALCCKKCNPVSHWHWVEYCLLGGPAPHTHAQDVRPDSHPYFLPSIPQHNTVSLSIPIPAPLRYRLTVSSSLVHCSRQNSFVVVWVCYLLVISPKSLRMSKFPLGVPSGQLLAESTLSIHELVSFCFCDPILPDEPNAVSCGAAAFYGGDVEDHSSLVEAVFPYLLCRVGGMDSACPTTCFLMPS